MFPIKTTESFNPQASSGSAGSPTGSAGHRRPLACFLGVEAIFWGYRPDFDSSGAPLSRILLCYLGISMRTFDLMSDDSKLIAFLSLRNGTLLIESPNTLLRCLHRF